MGSKFEYVSYIKTTPEKLWKTLTTSDLIKRYWFGMDIESEWKTTAPWVMKFPDGRVADRGEIVEFNVSKILVIRWRNEWNPEMKEEGYSRCVFDLEQVDGGVKLTVTHGIEVPNSKFIGSVSVGWPMVLSNLKSLLETGDVVLKDPPGHE